MTQPTLLALTEQLDSLGAEPLEGSGFEDEQPEGGFDDGGEDGND